MIPTPDRTSAVYLIDRAPLSPKEIDSFVSRMATNAQHFLQGEHDTFEAENRIILSDEASHAEASPISLFSHFDRFAKSQESSFLLRPPKFEVIELRTNTRVLSPPYDVSWSKGGGVGFGNDGSMVTYGTPGSSAAGIGIRLSSPNRVFATITPSGHYAFSWNSFENYPALSNAGGLGVAVYRGDEPTPILNRLAWLWKVHSPLQFTRDEGEGSLSHVYTGDGTPSPGTFATFLVPIDILMEPDVQYVVWIWTWQVTSMIEASGFLAFLRCNVPGITITTSPVTFPVIG